MITCFFPRNTRQLYLSYLSYLSYFSCCSSLRFCLSSQVRLRTSPSVPFILLLFFLPCLVLPSVQAMPPVNPVSLLVIVTGNPGVFQLYPYPYPPNPYPWPGVRVLAGMGKGLEGMEGLVGLVNFIG